MTRVLLVRHGESEWNADGRWQGQADPPLTDLGRRQALHATRSLGVVGAIVSSDLQRAADTAAIIAGELGVGPVVLDPDLRERHAGEWQGLTRDQIERDWPGYLGPPPPIQGRIERPIDGQGEASVGTRSGRLPPAAAPLATDDGPQRRPPGWEDDDALVERAVRALIRIHRLAEGAEAIAVTHGGLVYAIERILGAPFVRLPNLGGRWLEVGVEGPVALGDRVVLVDPDELTIPAQI